jgi:hypothetical protein
MENSMQDATRGGFLEGFQGFCRGWNPSDSHEKCAGFAAETAVRGKK